jgi:hypothetical protein
MTTDQIIDSLLDAGLSCEVLYPYVIVHQPFNQTPWTPAEIAEALDIDPETVTVNLNGNIRIIASDITL